jgi:hypothetical protein
MAFVPVLKKWIHADEEGRKKESETNESEITSSGKKIKKPPTTNNQQPTTNNQHLTHRSSSNIFCTSLVDLNTSSAHFLEGGPVKYSMPPPL